MLNGKDKYVYNVLKELIKIKMVFASKLVLAVKIITKKLENVNRVILDMN